MARDYLKKLDELGIPYEELESEVIGGREYVGYAIATDIPLDKMVAFYDYIGEDPDAVKEWNAWIEEHPIKASRKLSMKDPSLDPIEEAAEQARKNRLQVNVRVQENDGEA